MHEAANPHDTAQRRLVRGDFRPALEEAFVARVKAIRAADPLADVRVLVPSNLLKVHLRRLLAERDAPFVNVRFHTPLDLARDVAAPSLARAGLLPLPDYGHELLARAVAAQCPDGNHFRSVCALPGFAATLSSTLRDCRDALVPASALTGDAVKRVRDFGALLAAYETHLEGHRFSDDAMLFERAAAALAAGRKEAAAAAAATPLLVYGFYDFTGAQFVLLRALIERAPAALAFAPIGDGPAFTFAEPALRAFTALGFVEGPRAASGATPPPRAGTATALERLRDAIDAHRPCSPAASGDGTVVVLSSPGAPREAREIVRAVRDAVRDGYALHEIGVVFRGADFVRIADEAFREFRRAGGFARGDVPVFLHGGRPLAEQRAARAFLLLLDVLRNGLLRRDVFEWMHYGGVHPRSVQFERLARRAGIVGHGGIAEWRARLQASRDAAARAFAKAEQRDDNASGDGAAGADGGARHVVHEEKGAQPTREGLERRLRAFDDLLAWIERLEAARVELAGARTLSGMARAASGPFLEARKRRRRQDAGPGDPDHGADDVLAVLDKVARLDDLAAGHATPELFRDLIAGALASERTRDDGDPLDAAGAREPADAPPPRTTSFERGLFLGTLLPARGLSFRVLILPALQDGVFPRAARPDPILLDPERRRVSERANRGRFPHGVGGLAEASRAADEERMLFRLACGMARERLVMSTQRCDAKDGKERLPSPFVVAALERLAGRALEQKEWREQPWWRHVPIQDAAVALDLREHDRARVAAAIASRDAGRLRFLEQLHPPFASIVRAEKSRWRDRVHGEFDGVIPLDVAASIRSGPDKKPLSASRLEDYAGCPFRYFATRVLELRAEEDPDRVDQISPLDRGALIHAVLERFVREMAPHWPLVVTQPAAYRDRLLTIAREEMQRVEDEGVTGYPLLWRIERARVEEDLTEWLADQLAFQDELLPRHFEAAFGMGGDVGPLVLDAGDATIQVRGFIDRVDVDAAGRRARVIDYKTGKPYWKPEHGIAGGRKLQLALYALAVERVVAKGSRVQSALYWHCTAKGRFERLEMPRDTWDAQQDALFDVLGRIAGGIRDGIFFANPTHDTCSFCDYPLACGKGAGLEQRFARKLDDPNVRAVTGGGDGAAVEDASSGDARDA